jgi:ATP-binding cassette subfamily C protein
VASIALVAGFVVVVMLNRLVDMSRRAGFKQTKLAKRLLAQLTDTLQSVKPLRAMARESLITPLLEAETHRLNRALQREVISKATMRALQEPLFMILLAAGIYGALGFLGVPLATVIMMVFLTARILTNLGNVQREYQRMAAREGAFWSIRELIREAEAGEEEPSGGRAPELNREIRLSKVDFAYEEERWILRDASLVVPVGQMVGVCGPSGAGKTTVVDLVVGLLRPQRGEVLIDDVSLREIDVQRWRTSIGYVPQETLILHDTIATNVSLGDPNLSAGDVEGALRAAGAWHFVDELPEGTDAIVGERGMRFSGGQRQRIALARALVRRPKLLILDEATAALDPATEAEICATLNGLRGTMTILAISHRGRLMEIADRVYELRGGSLTTDASDAMGHELRAARE